MARNKIGDSLIVLSIIAIIFAIIGAFGFDLWLASTQWLLIAIALSSYGLYARIK